MSKRILVVDDETTIRSSLAEALAAEGHQVDAAASGEEALAMCRAAPYDLVVSDLKLPGASGLEVLQALRHQGAETPFIMMTAYGDVDTAVAAMRAGAYDFMQKPFKLGAIKQQVRAALRATEGDASRRAEPAGASAAGASAARGGAGSAPAVAAGATGSAGAARPAGGSDGYYMSMIRGCPGLADVARILEKIGASRSGNDTSVLIQGESGSGKEIVARAIHEVGEAHGEPFMEINCAAVPETLLESELFGHEKGAFTDAKARREGLFELAGRGTIFLDEIGEMGILLQSRLLRVIENRRFRRVGGGREDLAVQARVVAATNRRLEEAIRAGAFRNDLYYRLQVVEILVPALRERPQDLEVLVNHFIAEFNAALGLETEPASPALIESLQRYPWPGNVRELKNVLKRIMILEEPRRLSPEQFPTHILAGRDPRGAARPVSGAGLITLSELEQMQILYTLEMTANNKSKAARILGISRQTLREKLRLYKRDDADEGDETAAEAAAEAD